MARGRMLNNSISTSRKLSRVSCFDALLFTWTIPHCDDWGRMDGDAALVKAKVVPLRPETVDEVEAALQRLCDVGLIMLYEVNGELYLQVLYWEEHQYFRPDRPRAKSPYPEPDMTTPRQSPDNAGKPSTQIKLNQIKLNQTNTKGETGKGKVKEELTQEDLDKANAYVQAWNKIHGTKYKAYEPLAKNLHYWLTQYEPLEILQAVVNVKKDEFWRDKMEPTTLLRRKNPQGENVDYIGKMLHAHGRRENVPKSARIIF